MNSILKRIHLNFTALAGLAVAAGSIYFFSVWVYWLGFSTTYVYIFPHIPVSLTLLFMALGISLVSLAYRHYSLPRTLSLVVATIGLLDFSYDTIHFGIDFDQLLSSIFFHDHQFHFLHMAPNSSFAIICASLAIFLLARVDRKESTTFIANLLGGVVATLGVVSLFGHSTGIVSAYTWRNFVGMSVNTATIVATLGFAISFYALGSTSLRKRQIQIPILVAISLVAITLQLYRAQSDAEVRSVNASTRDRANAIEDQITARMREHVQILRRMAKRWDLENGTPKAVWIGDTSETLANLSGFKELCWINKEGVTSWCNPEHPEISVSDLSFEHLQESKKIFLIEPNHRGHRELRTLIRVSKNKKEDGALLGVIQIDRMIDDSFDFSGYSVVLQSNNDILFRSSSESFDAGWTLRFPFDYEGVNFVLNVTPLSNQVAKFQSRIPLFVLWLGFLLSLFIAYGTFLFIITREDALANQDRLAWEQAISIGSDLIFVTFDGKGLVKSFNPAAEKFFGYRANEIVDRVTPLIWHLPSEISNYAEACARELGYKVDSTIQALIAKTKNGKTDRNEWTFITKNGTAKKGELSIHPLHDKREETVGYVGIVRDTTEQRDAEAKLVQSSKMASLGEMASGVAHEINNPLTIIQGRAVRLMQLSDRSSDVTPEMLKEHAAGIVEMTRRIAKIVKGLATFSRNAEGDALEPTLVQQVLDDTLELCRERFRESGISLEVKPGPAEIILNCRPTQISQVLLNLLNNAFDAVQGLEIKWVVVEIAFAPYDKNQVQISIVDSGPGVSEAIVEKMMEPFFTTKEVGKGTGLGLSISKGIVESHGGKLFMDRNSAHTKFVIELPIGFTA